jgi:hypothetical protein
MNKDFKKQISLMILDKILFGSIIAIVGISFSLYVEYKYREVERREQMLRSVSKVNSDLVIEQRSGLTKSMGIFFREVSNYASHADRSKMDLDKINSLKDEIEISIYQIEALEPDFSEKPKVREFFKSLRDCYRYLAMGSGLNTEDIEKELDDVRGFYKDLLIELGQVSIKLANEDYKRVSTKKDL